VLFYNNDNYRIKQISDLAKAKTISYGMIEYSDFKAVEVTQQLNTQSVKDVT